MNVSAADAAQSQLMVAVARFVIVALAGLVLATPEPDGHLRSVLALCDYGHVAVFAMVTLLLPVAAGRDVGAGFGLAGRVLGAAAMAVLLGALIEWVQWRVGGNGDWGDVVRDAGGATAAVLMRLGLSGFGHRWRLGLWASALAILIWFALPTLTALRDELQAWQQFPDLVTFADARELARFSALPTDSHLDRYRDADGAERPGLAMVLEPIPYAGFTLRYFYGNWEGWDALVLPIVNQSGSPVRVNIRLDDADYRFELDWRDRYDHVFELKAGLNRVVVPLEDVLRGPQKRRFDLRRVRLLLLHGVDQRVRTRLILGGMHLQARPTLKTDGAQ